MKEQDMTKRVAGLGESVDRRMVLLGVLGAGTVALGGALYESEEKPRDGEALQALHAIQTTVGEVAERGVNGQTTSEETIAAILRRESGLAAKVGVALSKPLEHYASDNHAAYASAGANMVDALLHQVGQEIFIDRNEQMTVEITQQARPALAFLITALNQRRIGLGAHELLATCQQYRQEMIVPHAGQQTTEVRQEQLNLLEKELVSRLGQLADYDPELRLNRPTLG